MKSPCPNIRALILSLQPCSGQNDSGMTNLSFRAGNEWAGVLLFPYREDSQKKRFAKMWGGEGDILTT